jgi:hypothetical protein
MKKRKNAHAAIAIGRLASSRAPLLRNNLLRNGYVRPGESHVPAASYALLQRARCAGYYLVKHTSPPVLHINFNRQPTSCSHVTTCNESV